MLATISTPERITFEDYLNNLPEGMEFIDGELVEKNGMTLRHGEIQFKLAFAWQNYQNSHNIDGQTYTEVPCRTQKQIRIPDVAYLSPELVKEYGNLPTLPQSFPLCAEVISPTDLAENVFLKAREYLESNGEEVWLVFPESKWIMVITAEKGIMYSSGEIAKTEKILFGFSIEIDELFA